MRRSCYIRNFRNLHLCRVLPANIARGIIISFQDAINYVESENNFRIRIRAQSNRRLPPEMQSRGEIFSVKSDDALSRELMRKDREERERLRKEGKL